MRKPLPILASPPVQAQGLPSAWQSQGWHHSSGLALCFHGPKSPGAARPRHGHVLFSEMGSSGERGDLTSLAEASTNANKVSPKRDDSKPWPVAPRCCHLLPQNTHFSSCYSHRHRTAGSLYSKKPQGSATASLSLQAFTTFYMSASPAPTHCHLS